MLSLKEMLSPSRQNPAQQRGFFGALAIALIVVFLHFPFEGYYIEEYVRPHYIPGPCKKLFEEDVKNWSGEMLDQQMEENKKCSASAGTETQIRPFTEWTSRAPIFEWFGSVVHAIAAIVFAISIGGTWLWVFRTHNNG